MSHLTVDPESLLQLIDKIIVELPIHERMGWLERQHAVWVRAYLRCAPEEGEASLNIALDIRRRIEELRS